MSKVARRIFTSLSLLAIPCTLLAQGAVEADVQTSVMNSECEDISPFRIRENYEYEKTSAIPIAADSLKRLDGKIVTIKSAIGTGYYIDSFDKSTKVTSCPLSKIVDAIWAKFIIHHVSDNIVCLESVAFRDHYLDMNAAKKNGYHLVPLTQWNEVPKDQPWAKFSIWGDDFGRVGIRSERWVNRWLGNCGGRLYGTYNDPNLLPPNWGIFSIQFPVPTEDKYELIASHYNTTSNAYDYKYTYTHGMSRTDSTSEEMSIKLSIEAQSNFGTPLFGSGSVKFGTEFANIWSSSSSQTYSVAKQSEMTINILPGRKIEIYQLTGTYGPLKIGSDHFIAKEVKPN